MILWKLVKLVNLLLIQTFFVLFSSNLLGLLFLFSTRALDDLKGEIRRSVNRLATLVVLTGSSGMILW